MTALRGWTRDSTWVTRASPQRCPDLAAEPWRRALARPGCRTDWEARQQLSAAGLAELRTLLSARRGRSPRARLASHGHGAVLCRARRAASSPGTRLVGAIQGVAARVMLAQRRLMQDSRLAAAPDRHVDRLEGRAARISWHAWRWSWCSPPASSSTSCASTGLLGPCAPARRTCGARRRGHARCHRGSGNSSVPRPPSSRDCCSTWSSPGCASRIACRHRAPSRCTS